MDLLLIKNLGSRKPIEITYPIEYIDINKINYVNTICCGSLYF